MRKTLAICFHAMNKRTRDKKQKAPRKENLKEADEVGRVSLYFINTGTTHEYFHSNIIETIH